FLRGGRQHRPDVTDTNRFFSGVGGKSARKRAVQALSRPEGGEDRLGRAAGRSIELPERSPHVEVALREDEVIDHEVAVELAEADGALERASAEVVSLRLGRAVLEELPDEHVWRAVLLPAVSEDEIAG